MTIQDIIEKNKKAIILIDVQIPKENNQKTISIKGTGFIISEDGKFITNAHVYNAISESERQHMGASVPGKTNGNLTNYDRYPIKLIEKDEENDIALLQIITEGKKFQTVGDLGNSDLLKEGEEIIYIGYPLAVEMLQMGFGITLTTNECIVSSVKYRGVDGSMHFFLVDTHTNSGSSGSPVFSRDNKVIGVVSAKISSRIPAPDGKIIDIPANIGICKPIKYAIELINKSK